MEEIMTEIVYHWECEECGNEWETDGYYHGEFCVHCGNEFPYAEEKEIEIVECDLDDE